MQYIALLSGFSLADTFSQQLLYLKASDISRALCSHDALTDTSEPWNYLYFLQLSISQAATAVRDGLYEAWIDQQQKTH